jgi:predicted nucleic acid-binding protein
MIVIDTSVWIDHLNDQVTQKVARMRDLVGREPVLVGDIILCEILQGLRTEREAHLVEEALRQFELASMCGVEIASRAAANYRHLRARGVTVRKTIDLIIGTFCIENDHVLLHDDYDFEPMRQHLGLRVI